MSGAPRKNANSDGWRVLNRPDVILAIAMTVLLLPASLIAVVQAQAIPDPSAAAVITALFALVHAASLVSVRLPVTAFAVASLAMLALALLPGGAGVAGAPAALFPSSFAYLLCIGEVVALRTLSFALGALVVGVAGAAVIAWTPASSMADDIRMGLFVGLSAMIAAAWVIGLLQRQRGQYAEERQRTRVREAIAAERMRINRDLHDVVAHSMTVMIAQADVARALINDDPDASTRALRVVTDTGRDALRGMRSVIAADADAPREPVPDIDAIDGLVDRVRSTETDTRLEVTGAPRRLESDALIALHHAVREALTNAVRHTMPPRRITVALEWSANQVVVTVDDDGGSGPGPVSPGSGLGLIGMAERVRLAGGALSAGPQHQQGWRVRIELPYAEDEAARRDGRVG
ncbi:sensor histidine kinase [Microbacterium murale]|uniref:histidine kinase n=1 Tax=Microbacterium murale TaxID=1081040 RepID=A0ABU0P6Q0_9MICO|nr:histidine kinase [Microbacterium murale]MDQ0643009.1 signal transduction histidine kinase [Microbacterium murale]